MGVLLSSDVPFNENETKETIISEKILVRSKNSSIAYVFIITNFVNDISFCFKHISLIENFLFTEIISLIAYVARILLKFIRTNDHNCNVAAFFKR